MSDMKKYLKAVTQLDESFDPSLGEAYTSKDYGIRYKVFAGREGRLTTKEKWFATAAQLERFAEKVQNMGNFYEIDGYSYPRSNDALAADPVTEAPTEYMLHGITGNDRGQRPMDSGRLTRRYKLIQKGSVIDSYDTVDQAQRAWAGLPEYEKPQTKIRENVNGVDVDVIMEMDAGATCSASIATAPVESVFDKPQKRMAEDDKDGDSDFVGDPYKRDDADEDLTETIKAAFEDYVKGKDTDEKCKVKITYKDGHSQTKLVTDKEKQRYETSAGVDKVEVVKDGAARLDDAITESIGGNYGIRYIVFAGREGRLTTKEKWFKTAAQLEKFAAKVKNLDNFYEIAGYSYPSDDELAADKVTESVNVVFIGKFTKNGKNYALWQKGDYWYELTRSSQDAGGAYKHVHEWHDTSVEEIQDELQHLGFSSMANESTEVEEGVIDDIKRTAKSVKRGMQGWGKTDLPITGDENTPKDIVKRNKSLDDETLTRIDKAIKTPLGFPFRNGDYDGKDKHTPAGLQKRVVDREMKRRGLSNESADASPYHRVLVTLSDPNATMASKRGEKIQKHVRITGDLADAVNKAKAFYKKKGYRVHDAEVVDSYAISESVVTELDNGPKGRVQTDKINYDSRRGGDISVDKGRVQQNTDSEAKWRAEQNAAKSAQKSANSKASRLADKQTEKIELNQNVSFDTLAKLARDYAGVNDIADVINHRTYYTKINGEVVAGIQLDIYASYDPSDFGYDQDTIDSMGGENLSDLIKLRFARDPKNPSKIIFTGYGA